MDTSTQYGQMDMNLPHDVVNLPSGGKFYKNKKSSLKVGYLTANDENILMSPNIIQSEGVIRTLLKQKIYEPNFNVDELLDGDVQAILMFLRNTAFGTSYNIKAIDPITNKEFETKIELDEINFLKPEIEPNERGLFQFTLPSSGKVVECKLLNIGEQEEITKLTSQYPKGMIAPITTKTLEKQIVTLNGDDNKQNISVFISQMPIADSKYIRKELSKCEPRLDLNKQITAPSGEKVNVVVTFGAEFFRPFF